MAHDTPTDSALGVDLFRIVARFSRWATRHAEWALPVAQARLLGLIDDCGSARIGDLARTDRCTQPAMTTQVRRLEEAGLLERRADPADARAVQVSLTARGCEALEEVRRARAAAIAPLLERLSAAECAELRAAVGTLTKLLDYAESESDPSTATQEKT